jgi:glutamyl-Q tRNA(Asp) synthetase
MTNPAQDNHSGNALGAAPITRFAPSPTGALHLGHVYSALVAAKAGGGQFILRIDDIDHTRCRPAFSAQILDDLQWLGLNWRHPIAYQSDRLADYADALGRLRDMGMVYPCYLSRTEINDLLSAPHDANHDANPDANSDDADNITNNKSGAITDTQTHLPQDERRRRADDGMAPAWRLRSAAALALTGPLYWHDVANNHHIAVDMAPFGDVVIARKDIGTSYHLSVVIDDKLDKINLVTRGKDLSQSTHIHRLLQALLEIEPPRYLHHRLLHDEAGRRLAKRDKARSIASLREAGLSPKDVHEMMPELPNF